MENNKYWFFGSKLNTALLLILIILMIIAIKIMLKDKETYFPQISQESTFSPDDLQKQVDLNEEDKIIQKENEVVVGNLTLYRFGDLFSFKYKKDISNVMLYDGGNRVSLVDSNYEGTSNVHLSFLHQNFTFDASSCFDYPTGVKTMNINGKNFTYCDSKGEPARRYLYHKDGKTLIIDVNASYPTTFTNTYVDLGSVEIN